MAGHAVLIEDRPNVTTEIDAAMHPSGNHELGWRPDDRSKRDRGHGPGHATDHLPPSPDVKARVHIEPSRGKGLATSMIDPAGGARPSFMDSGLSQSSLDQD